MLANVGPIAKAYLAPEYYLCWVEQLDGTWKSVAAEDAMQMELMARVNEGDVRIAVIERK